MFKSFAKLMAVAAVLTLTSSAFAERHAPSRTPRPVAGVVNLNTATHQQLELLPGVGRKTARLIVDFREKQPFKAPAEVLNVKGVGPATYRKIKPYITVSGPTTLALAPKADKPTKSQEPASTGEAADVDEVASAQ